MSSVVHLATLYRCKILLYFTHTVSCCYVVSPFECTAAEFVCVLFSRIANPCYGGNMLRHGNLLPSAPAQPLHPTQESS